MTTPPRPPVVPPQPRRWIDNRTAIFVMLFCVTGFLGIPVLCASRGFSHTEKILWSVVVSVYTLILIGLTGIILWWSYTNIREAIGLVSA